MWLWRKTVDREVLLTKGWWHLGESRLMHVCQGKRRKAKLHAAENVKPPVMKSMMSYGQICSSYVGKHVESCLPCGRPLSGRPRRTKRWVCPSSRKSCETWFCHRWGRRAERHRLPPRRQRASIRRHPDTQVKYLDHYVFSRDNWKHVRTQPVTRGEWIHPGGRFDLVRIRSNELQSALWISKVKIIRR